MAFLHASGVAFAMPGGEASGPARARPIDLAHLARQTLGDRELEREVLNLFIQQALQMRDRIPGADMIERLRLVHTLKGSARGVGAFAIADCLADLETRPDDRQILRRLSMLIDEVRDFIAAISR